MSRRLPSLNALRAFEAAGRLRSLTSAAGELNVSHAAVSRHIRDLELWLGVELLRRNPRGVEPTEPGRDLLRELTAAFDTLTAAVDRVAVRRIRDRLRISVEESFAARWLIPRLGLFVEAEPEIELTIDAANTLVDFSRESYDLGIRWGRGKWPDVISEPIAAALVFPVCAPGILAGSLFNSPADLSGATLLHDDARELWSAWLAAAGLADLKAKGHMTLKGNLAVSAAEGGQGFALGDAINAGDSLRAGRLVKPFSLLLGQYGYYFVRAPNARLSKSSVAFRQFIRREMASHLSTLYPLLGIDGDPTDIT